MSLLIMILGVAWNLFLALIPVGLAYAIAYLWRKMSGRFWLQLTIAILALVWFFFLPNTCYLVTEWRHFLSTVDRNNLWIREQDRRAMMLIVAYSVFFLGYSLFGMITFTLAIRPILPLARRIIPRLWIVAVPFYLLMSLGVYLGLVLRYNSWDLLQRPEAVWNSALEALSRPYLATLIILFAVFLWLGYLFFDIWIDGYLLRRRNKHHILEGS